MRLVRKWYWLWFWCKMLIEKFLFWWRGVIGKENDWMTRSWSALILCSYFVNKCFFITQLCTLISCWALGRLKMGNDKRYVDALADLIFPEMRYSFIIWLIDIICLYFFFVFLCYCINHSIYLQFHWRNICRRRTNSSVFQVNKTRWSYIIKIKSLNIDGDEWKYVLLALRWEMRFIYSKLHMSIKALYYCLYSILVWFLYHYWSVSLLVYINKVFYFQNTPEKIIQLWFFATYSNDKILFLPSKPCQSKIYRKSVGP